MDAELINELKKSVRGEVVTDEETLALYSYCASLFEVKPQVVVFPIDDEDVTSVVKFINRHKLKNKNLSVTARAAGTDMGGGPLNESIILAFGKHMNKFLGMDGDTATAQPGLFYRDFEKQTLEHGLLFPSYPASREICAIGGIVNNNSGGEKSLEYGKTEKYIKKMNVVLSDGNEYQLVCLSEKELQKKIKQNNFEGEIYKKMFKLVKDNYDLLQKAKPNVSKNSAGYYLWNIYDKEKKTFDLTKLFVGAQGTLGITTKATLKLVPTKLHAEMMIIFINNLDHLGDIINAVAPLKPESFETYDDHTLKLAIKFFPEFAKKLGTKSMIETAWHFLPEFWMTVTGGLPKLILQVEFTGDKRSELNEKIKELHEKLAPFNLKTHIAPNKKSEKKYWLIRRESFNLLRQKIRDKHTAPFIDDFVVRPEFLPEFLPKLDLIFKKYPKLIYTIAGHMGDGNFHIIPLMNIEDPKQREIIPDLAKEVFELVLSYKGTLTGEHNDGIIRTPYLEEMYGKKVYELFKETKMIFDPKNIFNPGKKVGGSIKFAMSHIRTKW